MKSFSELTSASYVSNSDILAISQENNGTYSSKKTTVKEVSDFANQNFAEEYDSTSSYAVGDYVIYESVLYKCIGTTTGAFDSTKWTTVVVTDEMGQGGGGTGGHTIIDENGNSMTARAGLQFVGGANVSDDATNNRTIVDLASAGGIDGVFIDTDNIIQTSTSISTSSDTTYTATEDCALRYEIYSTSSLNGYLKVDNNWIIETAGSVYVANIIYVKKGQTVTMRSQGSSGSYTVYGIQTGTTHSKFQPVIYSTEEREIGVWTDGKPLYQKTYIGLNVEILNANTWYDTGLLASGVDVFVVGEMIDINNQAYPVNVAFMSSNTKIGISCGMSNRTGVILTIQYTKTTDVAGSGTWTPQGVPTHHYSTNEQVVGTWNGETLYERIFEVSHTFTQGDNDIELQSNVDFVSSDIKTYDATTVLSNGSASKRVSALANDTLYVNASNKLIMYFSCTNASVGTRTVRVVAQYTKSA